MQTDRHGLLRVARAALHFWEEPCISGTSGSGAVFFCGCGLQCVFCQNYRISRGGAGKNITTDRLSDIFLELAEKGADNINLVTAGHFIPQVTDALIRAKDRGLSIPVVYNTSSYERVEDIRWLDGLVDVYLPDFKFMDNELSQKYTRVSDYPETAKEAIREMVRQTGEAVFYIKGEKGRLDAEEYNESGEALMSHGKEVLMQRGTIVRHLLLPGSADDSKRIIRYLHDTYGDTIFLSIMNQYTPMPQTASDPLLGRRVRDSEYDEVIDFAISEGVCNAFIQEGDVAKESFIPDFDTNQGV